MSFETIETEFKRNKWTSIILTILFILGIIFTISDYSNRLVNIVKRISGYEEPILVEVTGNEGMEKRLNLARLEATKYKIPSSSTAIVKFLALPILNNYQENTIVANQDRSLAITVSLSPIESVTDSPIFDGTDCRFGVQASFFDRKKMKAKFNITSLSCTDNQGIVYGIEPSRSMGYISELRNPGISSIEIIGDEGYLTVNPDKNYFIQLYEPIESFNKRGISLFGRF